jgi:hypothetical protein
METDQALEKIKINQRSEEVADIIERMPSRFGLIITGIVLFIAALILLFGFLAEYPDKVTGPLIITAEKSPVKLVAGTSGKLLYMKLFRDKAPVKEGDYIAVIQNATDPVVVKDICGFLQARKNNLFDYGLLLDGLPKNVMLGELNEKYYALIKALTDSHNYYANNLLGKQQQQLSDLIAFDTEMEKEQHNELVVKQTNLSTSYHTYQRDSALFKEKYWLQLTMREHIFSIMALWPQITS